MYRNKTTIQTYLTFFFQIYIVLHSLYYLATVSLLALLYNKILKNKKQKFGGAHRAVPL